MGWSSAPVMEKHIKYHNKNKQNLFGLEHKTSKEKQECLELTPKFQKT